MRFEADTSRVVFSLVAGGVGWGLTTPLCLLQCADIVSQMDILPPPEPVFSREIYVITRKGENQGLAESILKICTDELQNSIVAELVKIAPGCGPHLTIAMDNSLGRRPAWQ